MARRLLRVVALTLVAAVARGEWGMREALATAGVVDRVAGEDEHGHQLPLGPYAASCDACALSLDEKTLTCRCGARRRSTSIDSAGCAPPRWIGVDAGGALTCEAMPTGAADAKAFRARGQVDAANLADRVMHVAWRAGSASEF